MLVGSEVNGAGLWAGFAVDVGVDVLFEVADDGGRQSRQGAGINAAIVGRAEGQQSETVAEQGRHEGRGVAVQAQAGRVEKEGIDLEELGGVGGGEVGGTSEREVLEVAEIGDGAGLFEGGVVGANGYGDVVDHVAVVGVAGLEGAEIIFQGIEIVFVAGVVDEPEVGDDIAEDAATTIAVDDVVDDEGGRGIGGGGVIGAGTEVEDDAVAVGMIGGAVEFTGDDIVGDDVVEAGVVVEPLVGV